MLKRKLLKPGKSGYKKKIFDAKTGETSVFVKLKVTPVAKTPSPADKFKIAFNRNIILIACHRILMVIIILYV